MKKIFLGFMILVSQAAFSNPVMVPSEFLAGPTQVNKANIAENSIDFAKNVDHIMEVQQDSLEKISDSHSKVSLTQMLTSFSVSHTGLFGLSALSASSSTTLFWTKKANPITKEEVRTFAVNTNDDELALQMKVDEITDYLVRENKVKDGATLRENLDKAMRRSHQLFSDLRWLESGNWKVGGFRLDLSISASGVVAPFTKVGESVRLWLEWTRTSKPSHAVIPTTKETVFVSNVLNDVEKSTSAISLPEFELNSLSVGLGEDYKTGFFGFGTATYGFIGYVKFVRKPKTEATLNIAENTSSDEEYPIIHEGSYEKSRFSFIPRHRVQSGIVQSLKFAQFFSHNSERTGSTHWQLTNIREIATITKSGFFGLSNLNTRGVLVFMFNRKEPKSETILSPAPSVTVDQLTLIRLSFVTMLGYKIPAIANFELRPNIEFFWK